MRLHPGGGGMVKGGPPFLVVGGRLHPGQSGLHTTLPWVQPTPPWLPVPPWVQFKFPRVINFDSPLNDSRQLEWPTPDLFASLIQSSHVFLCLVINFILQNVEMLIFGFILNKL